MQSFEKEEKSNGNVQFVLKESTRYVRGQYAIQLSYYKGKVYLHLQGKWYFELNNVNLQRQYWIYILKSCLSFNVLDNNNGKQVSLPDDVFETMNNQYFTINKAVDIIKKSNQGPPSPELVSYLIQCHRPYIQLIFLLRYIGVHWGVFSSINSLWWHHAKRSEWWI